MTDCLTDCVNTLPTGKNFRFQNQKCMLTYKTHLNKAEWQAWCFNTIKRAPKVCYIAHENGEADSDTPYEHSHIVIDFGFAVGTRNPRYFDYEGIHPHISLIKKPIEWVKACKYITKEDKTVILRPDDLDRTDGQVLDIWEQNTIGEALAKGNLRDATAIIAVWNHKPMDLPDPEICEEEFYPWQADANEILKNTPSGRKITWISDAIGNTGKTRFAKWLCLTQPGKAVMLNNIGRVSDFAQNMKGFWDSGWRGDTVFLNLSRSYNDRTSLYEAMEIIADGYVTCTKYTGGVVWLPKMHVVILANFEPALEKLSLDRWDIYKIDEKKELCPVTLNQAKYLQSVKDKFVFKPSA